MILKQLEEKEPLPDKEKNQIAWVRAANQHIFQFFYFPTAFPSADNLYTPVHNHIPNHTW